MGIPVVFSWSVGKDSAFGLWALLKDPVYEVRALLTTVTAVAEALRDRKTLSGRDVRQIMRESLPAALQVVERQIRMA